MPIYPYKCTSCEQTSEILSSLEERDTQSCPYCKGKVIRVEVTGFAVNSTIDPKTKTAHSASEVDVVVGTVSEQRWREHETRVQDRRNQPGYVDMGEVAPGNSSVNPLEILGSAKQKELGKSGMGALRAHLEKEAKEGTARSLGV